MRTGAVGLGLLIFAGLPIVLFLWFSLSAAHRLEGEEALRDRVTAASAGAGLVRERLAAGESHLNGFARRPMVIDQARDLRYEEMAGHARQVYESSDVFSYVVFFSPDGTAQAQHPDLGAVVARSFANEEWFQAFIVAWQPYATDLFQPPWDASAPPSAAVLVPVMDGERRVGVFMGGLDLRSLRQLIDPVGGGPGAITAVLDRKGRLITHPGLPITDGRSWSEFAVVRDLMRGMPSEGRFFDPTEDDERFVATALVEGFGWGVVSEGRVEDAVERVQPFADRALAVTGGLLLAVALAAAGLARLFGRNRRLVQELDLRNRRLTLLNNVAHRLSSEPRGQEALAAGITEVVAASQAEGGLVFLAEDEELTLGAGEGSEQQVEAAREIAARALETGVAQRTPTTNGRVNTAALPLSSKKAVVGVLVVWAAPGRALGDELGYLQSVAAQLGAAIENLELFERVSKSEERYRLLFENAKDAIFIANASDGTFVDANSEGERLLGHTRAELLTMSVADMRPKDEHEALQENMRRIIDEGGGSFEGIPLVGKDGRIILADFSTKVFSAGDRTLIQSIIRDVTNRKQIEQDLRRRNDELELMNRMWLAASHTFDESAIVDALCQGMGGLVDADAVAVYALNAAEEGLVLIGQHGMSPNMVFNVHALRVGEGVSGRVAQSGAPFEGAVAELEFLGPALTEEGFSRLASAPMAVRQRLIGVVSVSRKDDRAFSEWEMEVLETIARQAAVGVDNVRLYGQVQEAFEAEHRVAQALQRSLISELPQIPGVELGAHYASASHGTQVGGDFYDVFPLPDGRVALLLGDVCGKGVEAAAFTAMAKHLVRGLATERPAPPSVLFRLNNAVEAQLPLGAFITLIYGVYDLERGELTYSRGGHPSPVFSKNRGRRGKSRPGLALGVMRDQEYVEMRRSIQAGDTVVLFTDGIVEARRDGEFFGEERLTRIVRDHQDLGAQQLAEKLHRECTSFVGGVLSDDLAVVVLKRPND